MLATITDLQAELKELKMSLDETKTCWIICKRAVASRNIVDERWKIHKVPKLDVSRPKEYDGKRMLMPLINLLDTWRTTLWLFIWRRTMLS